MTISVPIGLQLGSKSGEIDVQGVGHGIISSTFLPTKKSSINSTGLQVQPGKTLALLGGNIALTGGILTAQTGRIELGSIGSGVVTFTSNSSGLLFNYNGVQNYRNIRLSQQALADTSGFNGGWVHLQGAQIKLTDGSLILIQNQGMQQSGGIRVDASDLLEVSGTSGATRTSSKLTTEALGLGPGENITVFTNNLIVQDGGEILTKTFSVGAGGNIAISAPKSVQVLRFNSIYPNDFSNISTTTFGPGRAGNLVLSASNLTIKDGGAVASATAGSGKSGDVNINADNLIELSGVIPISFTPSVIESSTASSGDAGNVTINASKLVLLNGGRVTSVTLASGKSGSVTVNSSDLVEVSGTVPGSRNPTLLDASANILDPTTQALFRAPAVPSGSSGDITINTKQLNVTDGGLISVRNDGPRDAGTLRINARSIFLDNQGSITASSASGEGGNIFLNAQNLQLRHNSPITASAGGNGNGGNINIVTKTLVALENSNISADALGGTGGRVSINTPGLFLSPDIKITATSQRGPQFNGVVQIKTLGFDTRNPLTPLTQKLDSPEQVIANSCLGHRNTAKSRFVIAGTGGLPTTPESGIDEWDTLIGVQPLSGRALQQQSNLKSKPAPAQRAWKIGDPIVAAKAMIVTPDGRTLLVSDPQEAALADPQTWICRPDMNQVELPNKI